MIKKTRKDFITPNLKKQDLIDAKKAFYTYMIEFKTMRYNIFNDKSLRLWAEIEDYRYKTENIDKVLSAKEKAELKAEKFKQRYEAQLKILEQINDTQSDVCI